MLKAKLSKKKKRINLLSFSVLALIAASICYVLRRRAYTAKN